jgi:hypothetical protein
MSRIDDILKNAKRDFEDYAKEKDLKVTKDPFAIDLVKVEVIKGETSYLLDKEIPLARLTNIPQYLKEVDLEVFDVLFKDENEQFKIRVNDLEDIRSIMTEYKSELFKKFGFVTVEFYRDNNELLKVDVNHFPDLINIIKDNEDKFRGIKNKEKRSKFDQRYHSAGDTGDIAVVFVGNVIIDEFENIISDEFGNCLSF